MDMENRNIVCDNGSGTIRIGLAGEEVPKCTFYSTAAGSKPTAELISKLKESPIEKGVIKDWDIMERIWSEGFRSYIQVTDGDSPVLMTEPILNPKKNREKMTEIMFETFNVPAFYLANQAVLSAYANGRVTGLVLDSGVDKTDAVPIYEGYAIPHAAIRLDIGGSHLTDYLDKMLKERGLSLTKETVGDIKEKLCCVDVDYNTETFKSFTSPVKSYKLPDGQMIRIEDELIKCPEAFFTPSLIGVDCKGIHEIIFDSIWKAHNPSHRERVLVDSYANIILSGGSSSFPDLPEKIKKEQPYDKRIKSGFGEMPVKIVKNFDVDRKNHAWIGGSIWASLSTAEQMWISKQEYQESGCSIVHTKCF